MDFGAIKARCDCRDVARMLGLQPTKQDKIPCFLHQGDTNASMQLYFDHYYCFGCQAHGDVIDLVSKYLGRDAKASAEWLCGAFAFPPIPSSPPQGGEKRENFNRKREHIYPGGQVKKVVFQKEDGGKFAAWYHKEGETWAKGRGNAPPMLYEAGTPDESVYVVEGEKDADTLARGGAYAVSGEHGAAKGKWLAEYTRRLAGKKITILSDNDEIGQAFAYETAMALSMVSNAVQLLDLREIWPEMPEHGDISDLFQAFGEEKGWEMLAELVAKTPLFIPTQTPKPEPEASAGWEEPLYFETIAVPDFPVDILPGPLSAFVLELARSTQTPEEMAGVLSLGVLATLFQRYYKVEVTPDWQEPLCLWPVAIADPAERKSAVINALLKPIYAYEADRQAAEAVEIAQNRAERTRLENLLKEAQKPPKKSKSGVIDFEGQKANIMNLSRQLAEFKDRNVFRLLIDDTTTEKLADILEEQDESITVASSEGGVFDNMGARYEKSGGYDIYLKAHAGDRYVVDRITRKQNVLNYPRLSMILTVQPVVLSGLINNNTMRKKGMCGRFLYAFCRSSLGKRDVNPPPISQRAKENYDYFIRSNLMKPYKGVIRLSREADLERQRWQTEIEKQLNSEWAHMKDWGGKLTGATVRIAALLHCAMVNGDPTQTEVPSFVMTAAQKIAWVLSRHAEVAYQMMGATEADEDAKYLWERIQASGKTELTRKNIHDFVQGRNMRNSEKLEAALNVLTERGYIREETRQTGGRPSMVTLVNPLAR